MSVERGFQRVAVVLSACGSIYGLIAFVAGEPMGTEMGILVAILMLWPWLAFFVVRWVARGFRSK